MKSSAKSKRSLISFVPDIPYHIQIVFVLCMCFIWCQAFVYDHDSELPSDSIEVQRIDVSDISFFISLIRKQIGGAQSLPARLFCALSIT